MPPETARPGAAPDAAMLEREQTLLAREAAASALRARRGRQRILAMQIGLLVLVLVGWWAASGTIVDRLFFSDPVAVGAALIRILRNGSLWFHLQLTLIEMVLGYVVGVAIGVAAAILVSLLPWGEPIARPVMLAAYATPKVALAPLIIVWFGIGLFPKIVLAASLVFFIVYFNTLAGIAGVNPGMIAVIRVMSATRAALFRKVILPSAAPFIFTAMRITLPAALIGAIIGEFVSSNRGIGYLIAAASSRYDTAQVFAGIFSLLVFVLVLNAGVSGFERWTLRWRPVEATGGARA
jgi:NitT/TauT family transport system permease protein